MKLSELEEKLAEVKAAHGDIQVWIRDADEGTYLKLELFTVLKTKEDPDMSVPALVLGGYY